MEVKVVTLDMEELVHLQQEFHGIGIKRISLSLSVLAVYPPAIMNRRSRKLYCTSSV